MDRRDEFAKAAMTGMLARTHDPGWDADLLVKDARIHADLLIAELDRTNPQRDDSIWEDHPRPWSSQTPSWAADNPTHVIADNHGTLVCRGFRSQAQAQAVIDALGFGS
jgi:hypothetical protein